MITVYHKENAYIVSLNCRLSSDKYCHCLDLRQMQEDQYKNCAILPELNIIFIIYIMFLWWDITSLYIILKAFFRACDITHFSIFLYKNSRKKFNSKKERKQTLAFLFQKESSFKPWVSHWGTLDHLKLSNDSHTFHLRF